MKNDSIKYSPWIKALCFALSVVMFALSAFNALYALRPVTIFSMDEYLTNDKKDFYSSHRAESIFSEEMNYLSILCGKTAGERKKELEKTKKAEIEKNLERFKNKKISIIKEELTYVATHYEEYLSDDEQMFSDSYINSIPDTPVENQKYPIDPYASANIRVARKILNYAEGDDFLKYESLIRTEALNNDSFYCNFEYIGNYYDEGISYDASIDTAKAFITDKANSTIQNEIENFRDSYNEAQEEVSSLVNIKYYIENGKKTLTNMTSEEKKAKDISEHKLYAAIENSKVDYNGLEEFNSRDTDTSSTIQNYFDGCEKVIIYMVNEDELTGNDKVVKAHDLYVDLSYSVEPYIAKTAVFLVLAIAALVVMLNLSGHKRGYDGITLSFIDKIPGDIHLALSALVIGAGGTGLIILLGYMLEKNDTFVFNRSVGLFAAAAALLWAVLAEWVASVVRTAKSEKSYFGNFIIVKLIVFIFRFLRKVFIKIKNSIRTSALKYKPKHFHRRTVILSTIALIVCPLIIWFAGAVSEGDAGFTFVVALIIAVAGAVAVRFFNKYVKNLDKVVEASQNRTPVDFGNEKLHQSIEILNNSLKISSDELSAAVENAVKNERTKTELLTNVSHDLKTPLTSIISYVDLLKTCEKGSEEEEKYISIIDEKSANLKVLIENLIEASKASAGNIKLNKAYINLKELAIQSIVEYAPEFESRNLDLRFNEECDAVTVLADGQQTYRVLENLLSNAKKYSAPNTRVYASVREENGFGVFEIKNMSNAPLDISPEELTERFVRGDASRGEQEGNGLGLSIAKDLCQLQDGRLEINIDGDLFKATVYLPIVK